MPRSFDVWVTRSAAGSVRSMRGMPACDAHRESRPGASGLRVHGGSTVTGKRGRGSRSTSIGPAGRMWGRGEHAGHSEPVWPDARALWSNCRFERRPSIIAAVRRQLRRHISHESMTEVSSDLADHSVWLTKLKSRVEQARQRTFVGQPGAAIVTSADRARVGLTVTAHEGRSSTRSRSASRVSCSSFETASHSSLSNTGFKWQATSSSLTCCSTRTDGRRRISASG